MQKFRADPIVQANSASDLLDIGANSFGEIRNLVDKGDLGCEKGVRRILCQFRSATVCKKDRRSIEMEWPVNFRDDALRSFVVGADDDPVRMLEIADRSALPQKLGIGHHGKFRLGI